MRQKNQLFLLSMIFKRVSFQLRQQAFKVQNRRCRIQCRFQIGTSGYSGDSKFPLLVIAGIILLFSLYFHKNMNDLKFDKITAIGNSRDSKSPHYSTPGIFNPCCRLQRGILEKIEFNFANTKISQNPLRIEIWAPYRVDPRKNSNKKILHCSLFKASKVHY
jgi:hypothetical protein